MPAMVVTLEVSKLNGWLKVDAFCRESNGGHSVRGEVQSIGRPEVAGDRGASGVQGRARVQIGSRARAERTRNMWYMVVTLDVSKLSGWLKADAFCRVETRAHDASEVRAGRRPGGGRHSGDGATSSAQGEVRLKGVGHRQGTRGAHPEHLAHVRDA